MLNLVRQYHSQPKQNFGCHATVTKVYISLSKLSSELVNWEGLQQFVSITFFVITPIPLWITCY